MHAVSKSILGALAGLALLVSAALPAQAQSQGYTAEELRSLMQEVLGPTQRMQTDNGTEFLLSEHRGLLVAFVPLFCENGSCREGYLFTLFRGPVATTVYPLLNRYHDLAIHGRAYLGDTGSLQVRQGVALMNHNVTAVRHSLERYRDHTLPHFYLSVIEVLRERGPGASMGASTGAATGPIAAGKVTPPKRYEQGADAAALEAALSSMAD